MAKEKEKENGFDTIIVRKQVIKNNVFKGYVDVEVSRVLAEAQLAKDPSQRHPDWKNVVRPGEEKTPGNNADLDKERERLAALKKELDERDAFLKMQEEELNKKQNPSK